MGKKFTAIRRIEARLNDMLRHIEIRALMSVQEARHEKDGQALPKLIETRAQIATAEAKAYADQSIGSLSKSLGASNRIVVGMMKRLAETEGTLARLAGTASRIDAIPEILNARITPVEIAMKEEGEALIARIAPIETAMKEDSETLIALKDGAAIARAEFTARCDALERELNRIIGDYNAQLRNAEHRIEFIRSETMYEMQAANYRASAPPSPARTEARIVAPAKVEAMRATGLKLNIGCGHIQLDGYLNADSRELPGIDVITDASNIPFAKNELAEIRSSHLVEHFTSHILERVVLPHWHSLLRPDGVLTTIAPDGAAMLEAVAKDEMSFDDFREVLFGGQDYDGDFHYNLITPDTFTGYLLRAGFKDITREYVGKRNGKCFEFKISAKKA